MYADLIEEKMVTGEKLADIVSSEDADRQLVVSSTALSRMLSESLVLAVAAGRYFKYSSL